jgi:ribose transport system ATP-binding protein
LRGIFGDLPASGEMRVCSQLMTKMNPRMAVNHGIALVPEDRGRDALFRERPVTENVTAVRTSDYARFGRLSRRRETNDARQLIDRFGVRTSSIFAPVGSLSGGNQQKSVIARWMRRHPRVQLLDEPSQGVDLVARAEIHSIIRVHVARGNSALVVSSDFEELEAVCDRALVLRAGRIVAELQGADLTATRMVALTQSEEGRNSNE